jgi:hypothetical protein
MPRFTSGEMASTLRQSMSPQRGSAFRPRRAHTRSRAQPLTFDPKSPFGSRWSCTPDTRRGSTSYSYPFNKDPGTQAALLPFYFAVSPLTESRKTARHPVVRKNSACTVLACSSQRSRSPIRPMRIMEVANNTSTTLPAVVADRGSVILGLRGPRIAAVTTTKRYGG